MPNRLVADAGAGYRGNTAEFGASATGAQRGGFGSEQNPSGDQSQGTLSSQMAGNPHSSRGFRRALEKTQRKSSSLKDQMPDKVTFGNKGYKKPSYFAQGGRRHGMHISTGAPHTSGASDTGADTGA